MRFQAAFRLNKEVSFKANCLFLGQIVIFRANFSAPPVKCLPVRLCTCFISASNDDRLDASIKAKHIHRRQPANPFCSFTWHTSPNIFPVFTNPKKKLLIATTLTYSAIHFTFSNHPIHLVLNKTV